MKLLLLISLLSTASAADQYTTNDHGHITRWYSNELRINPYTNFWQKTNDLRVLSGGTNLFWIRDYSSQDKAVIETTFEPVISKSNGTWQIRFKPKPVNWTNSQLVVLRVIRTNIVQRPPRYYTIQTNHETHFVLGLREGTNTMELMTIRKP